MKRFLAMALSLTMLLSMVACGSTAKKEEETKPVLKVGTSADYPPFEYHKDIDGKDTIVGVDIDFANYICDKLGYELQLVDMSFDGLIGSLNEGNFDIIISGLSVDPTRNCDFTIPYYGADQVVVTTKDKAADLNASEDLMGKKIGGLMGSVQEELAIEYAGDTAVAIQNFQDSVMMVQEGGLDGIICEVGVANSVIGANDDLVVTEAYIDAGENSIAIGVQKGDTELVELINPVIEEVLDQGLMTTWLENHQQ